MRDLINETGISFSSGEKLTSSQLNTLNDRINLLVKQVNAMMKAEVNVNAEEGKPERRYTLDEVLNLIPEGRQVPGVHVRFLGAKGQEDYTWLGGEWTDKETWIVSRESDTVDGGEW